MATIAYKVSTQDGTKTLPAYTFDSDPDSGWYRQGAGAIRLSVDDTDVINATSAGIAIPGALTLTFGGDAVLSRGAANRLDLASGDSLNIVSGDLTVGGQIVVTDIGPHAIGGATNSAIQLFLLGTSAAGTNTAFRTSTTVNPAPGDDAAGMVIAPTLVEFSSGTHSIFMGLDLRVPTVTAGNASLTDTAVLRVRGAMSAGASNNYAILVDSGLVSLGGTLTITGDIGFYGQAATAKPTGVAVTEAGIHAALVTLNLIAGP